MDTVACHISSLVQAMRNCEKSGNTEWRARHKRRLQVIVENYLPSGAGWDSGTRVDADISQPQRLEFSGAYHHMNDSGFYTGWSEHRVIVTPTFDGVDVRVTGRDVNEIKEHIAELFYTALTMRVDRVAIDTLYAQQLQQETANS